MAQRNSAPGSLRFQAATQSSSKKKQDNADMENVMTTNLDVYLRRPAKSESKTTMARKPFIPSAVKPKARQQGPGLRKSSTQSNGTKIPASFLGKEAPPTVTVDFSAHA